MKENIENQASFKENFSDFQKGDVPFDLTQKFQSQESNREYARHLLQFLDQFLEAGKDPEISLSELKESYGSYEGISFKEFEESDDEFTKELLLGSHPFLDVKTKEEILEIATIERKRVAKELDEALGLEN